MRINNLEFIRNHSEKRDAEIVCWQPKTDGTEYRYTILWYCLNKEGWQIEFVGDRPFTVVDEEGVLWDLMYYGQQVLNAEFKLKENLK